MVDPGNRAVVLRTIDATTEAEIAIHSQFKRNAKMTHQLFAHDCEECGEGNLYYDRPGPMACDHCLNTVFAQAVGEPFEDDALDES